MVWLILALMILVLPMKWILSATLAVIIHELGHYTALRLCGVEVMGIRVSTGSVRMRVDRMKPWQEAVCALSGPLAGFSLLLFSRLLPRAAVCGFVHSLYNLLPIYPLDGGRVIRSLGLSKAGCRIIEGVCVIGILIAGVYGCLVLKLGAIPIFVSIMTIHRALEGKGLEMRSIFRYNRRRKHK